MPHPGPIIGHHYPPIHHGHGHSHGHWHDCCCGNSIWCTGGGYGGSFFGGIKGGFWGGFQTAFGQCLGGWLGGLASGLMSGMMGGMMGMSMYGGGWFGGMMGMPFMGGGSFSGFNLYPENYDWMGMNMGYGYGYGYGNVYPSNVTLKPASNTVEPLAKGETETVGPVAAAAEKPEALELDSLLSNLTTKTLFTEQELETLVAGEIPQDEKDAVKNILLSQLQNLKAKDENSNEYYKISQDYGVLKALELLCKLEPNTVVRCVTRDQSNDKFIQGTISNVKRDGNKITYNITCKELVENDEKCGCILGAVYEMEQKGGKCKPTNVYKDIAGNRTKVQFNTATDYRFEGGIWVNKADPTVSAEEIKRIKNIENPDEE